MSGISQQKIFGYVRNESKTYYDNCVKILKSMPTGFGFRGRYDAIDADEHRLLSNSPLVLGTLGKEIEGLYYYREGRSTFVEEDGKPPRHGLITVDVHGLLTIVNEEIFWKLEASAEKANFPINFENMMFYESWSALMEQPAQKQFSNFMLKFTSSSEGTAVIVNSNASGNDEENNVRINPLKRKDDEREYFEFGKCPTESWNLFPTYDDVMKAVRRKRE